MNFENEINELKKSLHEVINERDSIQKLYSQSQNEKDYAETRTRKLECELFNLISASSSTDNEIEKTVAYLKTHIEDYKKRHDRSMGTQIELRQENVALKRELKLMLKHLDSNDMNDQVIASLNSEIKELQTELEEKNKNKMMNESKQESSENTKEEKCLDEIKSLKDQFNMDKIKAKEEYDELKSRYDKILEEKKIFEKKLGKSNPEELVSSLENDKKDTYARSKQKSDLESAVLSLRVENECLQVETAEIQAKKTELQAKMDDALGSNVDALENDSDSIDQRSKEVNDLKFKLNESEYIKSKQATMIVDLKSALLKSPKENPNSSKTCIKEIEASASNGEGEQIRTNALIKELYELQSTKLKNESIISKLEAALAGREAIVGQQVVTQSAHALQWRAESLSIENEMLLSVMKMIEITDTHRVHIRSHILKLAKVVFFTCDDCQLEGSGWAWQCQKCDDVLHIKCNKHY